MRHFLLFVLVIYVVVISNAWAQNRGSVRYVPPENYDGGDSTRAPRPAPTRGAAVNRRQRTTKAPETPAPVIDEQPKASYQPAETPSRTTGRRVPQRSNTRQVAPPPPPPPTPVIEPAALYPAPGAEVPEIPTTGPEGRPQGTRRRRPKKRRKPQAVVPKEEDAIDKPGAISELVNDDRKRTEEFSNAPQLRHSPHNSETDRIPHPEVINIPIHQPQENSAGSQFFRPQPATNRLPVDDSDQRGNSGYLDPSIVNPNADVSNEYVRKEHSTSIRNEGNYVPVLSPDRLPSDGTSRLPLQNYPVTRNREYVGETLPSDKYVPFGLQGGNSYTGQSPNTVSGVQPTSNIIPQPGEFTDPIHGNSENRLPSAEHSFLSSEHGTSGGNEEHLKSENRLINPSEALDSTYPHYSSVPQRLAGRRQESGDSNVRRNAPPNTPSRRDTKPDESDNDAQFDRRQTSQYRPPLQRTHSRYKPEEASEVTKAQAQSENPVPTSPPRSRGSSRYQSERKRTTEEPVKENAPSRTRSSSTSRSSSTRGRQPAAAVIETTSTARPSSRRQPVTVIPPRKVEYTPEPPAYRPIEEDSGSDHRIHSNPHEIQHQSAASSRTEADEEQEYGSIRNTLRSRPQYEVRDTEPYEESVENANTYDNEYQLPRQPPVRGRPHQRNPTPRQQLPQPEYQQPTYRQYNRPEPQHEAPEPEYQQPTHRQQRPEPQYEAPQNSRSRQLPQYQQPQNPRQNVPVPRQQVRPRQQEPEAPAARSRHTTASKFVCPEAYGYYADPVQCDKYYECRNGTAEVNICNDGLAFNEISAPKFLRCDSFRDVDCKSRPELQEPKPSKNCPRQFGLYAHETDCTKFWNCVDGTATEVQCPPGLIYNDNLGTCDWADLVENSCKSEDLLGFTCPEATAYDLQDGVYSSYPHPDNCQLHYICIKGADGLRRPRLLTCNEGQVFNPTTASCTRPDDVAGCEDFYGPRSPPKRRPAPRDPEPEEELIEEPTPKPRRRVNTNRRTRN